MPEPQKLALAVKELLPVAQPDWDRLPVWERETVKEEEPQLELVLQGLCVTEVEKVGLPVGD